jgi:hypothetical protein
MLQLLLLLRHIHVNPWARRHETSGKSGAETRRRRRRRREMVGVSDRKQLHDDYPTMSCTYFGRTNSMANRASKAQA